LFNLEDVEVHVAEGHPTSVKTVWLAAIFKEEKETKTKLDMATDEVNIYKKISQISLDSDPLLWWKENAFFFPLLANVAKSRFCIPATSVPSERKFSTVGDIATAQRACLNPSVVSSH
jgi:hypothetical protein